MHPKAKRHYLRLVRRAYRGLRHKQVREIKWLQALLLPVFDRELWRPCRGTVATGLSIGLFTAMLPIPLQMVIAAAGSIRMRANIPIAVAASWLSNPFTIGPIILMQEQFGSRLQEFFYLPMPALLLKSNMTILQHSLNLGHFVLGFFASAVLLALLAFPLVYLVAAALPKLLPPRSYYASRPQRRSKKNLQEPI